MVKMDTVDNIKSISNLFIKIRHYLHKNKKKIQVKNMRAKKLPLKDGVYVLSTLTY